MYSIRLATPDDATAGARMHLASWRETYPGLVDPAFLEPILADEQRWINGWRRTLETGNPGWVAEAPEHGVVGFAAAGPELEDIATPSGAGLQLYAIYLLAAWHGSGAGQALLDAAIGAQPCSVWVLRGNDRATAFYQRNGFAADGVETFDAQLDRWEFRMVRTVDPSLT